MPKIRGNPAEKWVRRASAAGPDYQSGVQNPRVSWSAAAGAAEPNWAAGVSAAVAAKRFSKGVAKAGDAKWQDRSVRLGVPRFAQGVAESENSYAQGVAPYLAIISGLSLPPRGPRGAAGNLARVSAITTALRNRKVQGV